MPNVLSTDQLKNHLRNAMTALNNAPTLMAQANAAHRALNYASQLIERQSQELGAANIRALQLADKIADLETARVQHACFIKQLDERVAALMRERDTSPVVM